MRTEQEIQTEIEETRAAGRMRHERRVTIMHEGKEYPDKQAWADEQFIQRCTARVNALRWVLGEEQVVYSCNECDFTAESHVAVMRHKLEKHSHV